MFRNIFNLSKSVKNTTNLILNSRIKQVTHFTHNTLLNKRKIHFSNYLKNDYLKNHIPISQEVLLKKLNYDSIESFLNDVYTDNKQFTINIDEQNYNRAINELNSMGKKNHLLKSYYGQGFYNNFPIKHLHNNFLLNPNFYSAYIPYQSEISQGRLELLYNYQTMICNLTNMDIANCSLLDESSACAEAMISLYNYVNKKQKNPVILIDSNCFKQHISVLKTRANSLNIEYDIFDIQNAIKNNKPFLENSIAIFHMQNRMGELIDLKYTLNYLKNYNIKTVVVMDPLASTIYEPPGSYNADMVVGSTQRFGLPMWNGGPHAAFFAAKQKYTRYIPGRIVGKSIDTENNPGYRLALQTREQHIKKDKAFSNICTSQALLANYNVLYAMYLGPNELQKRALTIKNKTILLRELLKKHLDTRYYNIT